MIVCWDGNKLSFASEPYALGDVSRKHILDFNDIQRHKSEGASELIPLPTDGLSY